MAFQESKSALIQNFTSWINVFLANYMTQLEDLDPEEKSILEETFKNLKEQVESLTDQLTEKTKKEQVEELNDQLTEKNRQVEELNNQLAQKNKAKIAAKNKMKQMQDEMECLRAQLEDEKKTKGVLQEKLVATNLQLADSKKKVEDGQMEIEELQNVKCKLDKEIEALQDSIDELTVENSKIAKSSEKNASDRDAAEARARQAEKKSLFLSTQLETLQDKLDEVERARKQLQTERDSLVESKEDDAGKNVHELAKVNKALEQELKELKQLLEATKVELQMAKLHFEIKLQEVNMIHELDMAAKVEAAEEAHHN